jgi:long-chain fatty acid transport protein
MKFTTPSMLFVGLSYSFRKWNFSFDTYWTEWSVQDRLIASSNSILLGDTIIEKKWEDTLTFGLGIQYALSERCHLFAGYIYDQSPVPKDTLDAMVFHGDSQIFCTGFDFTYKSVVLGVAYGYIIAANQSFNNSVGNASNPGGGQVTGAFENSTQNVVSMNMNFMF